MPAIALLVGFCRARPAWNAADLLKATRIFTCRQALQRSANGAGCWCGHSGQHTTAMIYAISATGRVNIANGAVQLPEPGLEQAWATR